MDKIKKEHLLIFSVFIISTCGLVYELVAGALASYLLGDSVRQFSFVIGVYLFSMGLGSYISKYLRKNILSTFVEVEFLIGIVGGLSSTLLFVLFEYVQFFQGVLYLLVVLTGIFVGLEIPLLMNLLKNKFKFSDLVSNIFTFDYIGSLLASILFPLVLVPFLGLMRTSLFFGMINVSIALWVAFSLKEELTKVRFLKIRGIIILCILAIFFIFSNKILRFSENKLYGEDIIFAHSTSYQRIVLTHNKAEYRLYLNNNLQFSSKDEYRYHEALVHPAMSMAPRANHILIMGGGDGLAAREILKYPEVKDITLVDLDKNMTTFFSENEVMTQFNKGSLTNSKLKVVNQDAFLWVKNHKDSFDVAIIDFPDPSNYSLGKLFSTSFYENLKNVLSPNAVITIQTTSPFFAPNSFWCVYNTLATVFPSVKAYHTYVPSFGEWGFSMAVNNPAINFNSVRRQVNGLHFYNYDFKELCQFSKDMSWRKTDENRLDNQSLVRYFDEEWGKVQ
ncbi:polyamine aminopropyltransferase [Rhizosphaericola mali]|uniref:Polyamine aminopropyltransferase n=1 Tax=Rhizosphaericola mali TaxID=2545455 RepID=A0A5P2FUU7_9BACT|nr:polyamine aminopropyltransferase [Rhizosphaericola mali]QES87234.1 polyamine aminopropyltransferase [Rhizosphaericola mali]